MLNWPNAGHGGCACRFVRAEDFGPIEQVEWCARHATERDLLAALKMFHSFFIGKEEGIFSRLKNGESAFALHLQASHLLASRSPQDAKPAVTGQSGVATARPQMLESPTFDSSGDPTDETLEMIACWQPDFENGDDPWAGLLRFCRDAWNMDYGVIREEAGAGEERLICFVTGGLSSNEAVQCAMDRNWMFTAMRWDSSYRGGLVKYRTARE